MLFKDPSSRALLFAPAVKRTLFGYSASYDLTHVPYAVLDTTARLHLRTYWLDGTGVFERETTLTTSDQIADMNDSGRALVVIAFQSDFEARLASGQQVQVILDGRNSSTAGLAAAYVSSIVADFNQWA